MILSLVKTLINLGINNVANVLIYKFKLKFKIHPSQFIIPNSCKKPFFIDSKLKALNISPLQTWKKNMIFFGKEGEKITSNRLDFYVGLRDYQKNKITELNWWEISDFYNDFGDIKKLWEASRMEWLLPLSQRFNEGQKKALITLNDWLEDWCNDNPAYKGPNWKCAQECSVRVIRIASCGIILNNIKHLPVGSQNFLKTHLKRISTTISYSKSQQNNHIISEGVALFVGGSWLNKLGYMEGKKWEKIGKNIIEVQIKKLVSNSGGFSQYSLCYHRFFLDIISFAEIWREKLNLVKFSNIFYTKGQVATNWLRSMVNYENGKVPNIGANDGSYLLPLTCLDFNDYRPSLQTASIVFFKTRALEYGLWDTQAKWLRIKIPNKISPNFFNYLCKDTGFAVLSNKIAKVIMKFPNYKFRPGHSDLLHVDLWINNSNILCDLGSYSYNKGNYWLDYFTNVKNHNTISLDNFEPMKKWSRFLFLDWLKYSKISPNQFNEKTKSFECSYEVQNNFFHKRKINLKNRMLIVQDKISGKRKQAVLNWNLNNKDWKIFNGKNKCYMCYFDNIKITIKCDKKVISFDLVKGWESKFYNMKTKTNMLKLKVYNNCTIKTIVEW